MGTTPLWRFLHNLCDNSCWNYAVFWKLQLQDQMLLTWEDGYFGAINVQDSMEHMFGETSCGGIEETSSSNTYNVTSGGDAVQMAVTCMSNFQYALGDGVVGDVAYTGNSRWVFAGSYPSGEFNTASISENADKWLFQFAAGVKTILLVPVIPHGVLQLGSLEDLHEDAQMANYIKDEFIAHQDFMGYYDPFATDQQIPSLSSSSLMSTMMESLNEFPSFILNGKATDDSTTSWSNHEPVTKSLVTTIHDSWYSSDLLEPLQITNLINPEVVENSKSDMLLMKQPSVSDVGSFLSFPKECELHKALGPAFMGKANDFMGKANDSFQNLSIGEEGIYISSDQLHSEDLIGSSSNGMLTSVEIAVTNSFGQAKRKSLDDISALKGESSLLSSHVASAVFSRVKNHNDSSSPSAISYEGIVDEFTEQEEQKSRYDMHQSKGAKPCVASKRRGKPCAKQKPRPRDRQLIQDRLKDLRELVPDGAKCSIDGLLDRTVKHMLFLKSVSDRAVKLRQCVQPGEAKPDRKNDGVPENRGGSQNGASWAFELGGDLKACPILVEDLQYPGHMIIEMICDENSRFLEIAEVIHGLDLTILNGATEKRSGNTWARYIVEAPRGFHRLDIFWPLMKLLQQQQQQQQQHSPISSKI